MRKYFPQMRSGVCLCLLMVALATAGWAQEYRATITGAVTDPSGAAIPGAKVTVTNLGNGFVTPATTNAAGNYSAPFLAPGVYTIRVAAAKFASATRTAVELHSGDQLHIDFRLQLGEASQTVHVSANGEQLQTATASIGQVMTGNQVASLPIIGRNTFMVASLSAGMQTGLAQQRASQFGRPFDGAAVQMSANGTPGQTYQITLDGMADDLPERASGAVYTGFVPPPDAVEEVNTQTSLYDAEYGHTSGAVINTVLKSGTNQFHGDVYWYFRNTALNANCFQCNYAHTAKAVSQWNQPGLVFSGPVRIPGLYNGKDKTFFMVSWELIRNSNPTPGVTTVPTDAERQGDFSGLVDSKGNKILIYDPLTTVTSGNGARQAFANNLIPSNRIDPVAKALLQYFPEPNAPGQNGFNNFVFAPNDQVDQYHSLTIRIDHQFSDMNKLAGTFEKSIRHQTFPTAGLPAAASGGYSHFRNNTGGSLDWTRILSPVTVLDVRAGAMYHPFQVENDGDNFNLASLGFPSSLLSSVHPTFPHIQLSNDVSLGAGASQFSTSAGLDLAATLSHTMGAHTLKTGFQFNAMRATLDTPESSFGSFTFNGGWTKSSATNASGTSGWDFADFLLGDPSSGGLSTNSAYAYQRFYYAGFLQDDWRVNQRLTLNLGLRWDYESPFSERYDQQNAGFCTTCTNPINSQVSNFRPLYGGLLFTNASNRLPFKRDLAGWGPRIGAAYRLTSKSVLRGGFGMTYAPTFDTGGNNGFSIGTSYIASTDGYTPANSLSNPYPNGVNAPIGRSQGLQTLLGQGFTFSDPNRRIPRVYEFSLGLQYELPGQTVAEVSYVGNRSQNLELTQSINALPASYFSQSNALLAQTANPMAGLLPGTSGLNKATLPAEDLLVPYPEFGGISESNLPYGSSSDDSLQVMVSKRASHGLSFRSSFTWAKIMDQNSYLNSSDPVTAPARYQDWQPNLIFTFTPTWELPFFAHSSGILKEALGGWETAAVFRWENGSLVGNPGGAFSTGLNPTLPSGQQSLNHWFNTCTVTLKGSLQNCPSGATAADAAWTQQPAWTLRVLSPSMPGVRSHVPPNLDLSVFKRFPLFETVNTEIRADIFNLANTPQFGGPNTSLNSSQFGVVTPSQVNDPRIIQLALKVQF